MSPLLISILMPVKNTGSFLAECLQSIIEQSYHHWELIAINDHSTDNSLDILQAYAQKDQRIRVLNNEGKGIIQALRLAYQHSKGVLITRMDADDKMTKQKLEQMSKVLQQNGVGHLAIGQVAYFSATTLGNGYLKYQDWLNALSKTGNNFTEIYKECVIPSPCWMLYRADLDRCGAFQPNRYPEDYDLCFRFYQNQLKVIPSPLVLHHWRDYPNRTSRTDEHYADNRFLQLKLDYFLKLDYNTDHTLVLWGAGKKGKSLARQLIAKQQPFIWICNNERKIGKSIYEQILQPIESIHQLKKSQFLIAVAGDAPQKEILDYLTQKKWVQGADYFFFC
jgi:glycosyltransferase involved in cell wall biosynthesis